MNQVEKFLRLASDALKRQNNGFALVGGFAIMARCQPRFTRDADLAVAVADDAEAETVVLHLTQCGLRVVGALEQTNVLRLAAIRLAPPDGEEAVLDLLFASSGIESEIVAGADLLEIIPDLILPVASVACLIAIKTLTEAPRRPQDRSDLIWLFEVATPADMMEAERLLTLIIARGFDREGELQEKFKRLRGELGVG